MRCAAYLLPTKVDLKQAQEALSAHYQVTLFDEAICIDLDEDRFAFIFHYGSFVFWNFSPQEEADIIDQLIKDEKTRATLFIEVFSFDYGTQQHVLQDHITLESHNKKMQMLAVSYALSQSAVLSDFEGKISKEIDANTFITKDLATRGKIRLSRKSMSKKMGHILQQRNQVNLHTDILDTPEFVWDHPAYEPLYSMAIHDLDLQARTSVLNTRMDILKDLFEVMSNTLNTRHGVMIEWIIVLLIFIEVILSLLQHVFHVL